MGQSVRCDMNESNPIITIHNNNNINNNKY